jgi:hypothetical protein
VGWAEDLFVPRSSRSFQWVISELTGLAHFLIDGPTFADCSPCGHLGQPA